MNSVTKNTFGAMQTDPNTIFLSIPQNSEAFQS